MSGIITGDVNVVVTYTPDNDSNNNWYADEEETQYTLTIHYINTHSWMVFADYVSRLVSWANYNVISPTKVHYMIQTWGEVISGTMSAENIEFYVIYIPDVDENGNGVADDEEKPSVVYWYSWRRRRKSIKMGSGTHSAAEDLPSQDLQEETDKSDLPFVDLEKYDANYSYEQNKAYQFMYLNTLSI